MGAKEDFEKIGQMAKKYLTPMVKGGADVYIANLFDKFLEDREGEIRRALGVHYTDPVIKPLRRLFRDFIEDRNSTAPKQDSAPPAAGPIPKEPAQRIRVNTVFDEDVEEEDFGEEPVRRRNNPWA